MTTQPDYTELVAQARLARERAYCPYSHFPVGAAILAADGRVFHGCNVENAAFPATICAERAALMSAYSAGARAIVALAVVADTAGPVSPCGTCRQVLAELAPSCTVVLTNLHGATQITTPQELLPGAFGGESLR